MGDRTEVIKQLIIAGILLTANVSFASGDLNVEGKITLGGAIHTNKHVTHTKWYNMAVAPQGPWVPGYVKLVTPINQFEENMFLLKINGYRYGHSRPIEIRCAGYAYDPAGLIQAGCHTDGTNDPVGIKSENDKVIVTIGSGTGGAWYFDHFSVDYSGWKSKNGDDFLWEFVYNTAPNTVNTNNVHIDDINGTITSTVSSGSNLFLVKTTGSSIAFSDGTKQNALIEAAATSNELEFWTNTAANTGIVKRMIIDNVGNIGIGTSSPVVKLDVQGQVASNGVVLTSDAKFKKNLLPIGNPLNKIVKLQGLSYDWKTEEYKDKGFSSGRHYGVIAQEIEKVLPEVVNTNSKGEKSVAYTEIIPVLIEAIKEQQKMMENQNKVIENQQKQITELKQLISK